MHFFLGTRASRSLFAGKMPALPDLAQAGSE